MKKILFTALAVFTFCSVNAQSREKGAIELIPQIGYSSANYYGEEDFDSTPLSSVTFGVGADYFFNDRWSLRSGLHYQKMGAEGDAGYKEELNFLTLPVNANWHFGSTRKWNLNFGPSVSFLTSAENNSGDIKDGITSLQIGLAYGIGYKIEVSEKFSVLIDLQGITGFSKAYKDSDFTNKNAFSSINVGGVFVL